MIVYYSIVMFVFGTCFGSFYNVVGYRLPRNMSIVKPNSHCTSCNHELKILDLFPIISYIFLRGKCRYCGSKVGLFYPIFEIFTGILFTVSYLIFGFTPELAIALIFISLLLIVIISDYQTMIIPDSILVVSSIMVIIIDLITKGLIPTLQMLGNGIIAFSIMLILKLLGDFLFKKESMGGGDIKLMFVFGLVLGWPTAILAIFVASFIGLPISLVLISGKKSHEVPFGPFLAAAAILLIITKVNMTEFLNIIMTNN